MTTINFTFDGLRGVGRVELALPQKDAGVYVLFGGNGVGKTKTLEAIYQGLLFTNSTFHSLVAAAQQPRVYSGLEGKSFVAQTYQHNGQALSLSSAVSPSLQDTPQVLMAWVQGWPFHDMPVVMVRVRNRGVIPTEAGRKTSEAAGNLEQRRDRYFTDVFDEMRAGSPTYSTNDSIEKWFVRLALTKNPYQENEDQRFVEIDTVLDILHQLDARFDADPKSLKIDGNFNVSIRVDGEMRRFSELSSGFASLLQVVQTIVYGYGCFTNEVNLRSVKGIVLIDEIESHLHNEWQVKIVPTLKRLFPNTVFFIATHSALVVSQLDNHEAFLLQREVDGVVRTKEIQGTGNRLFSDMLDDAFGLNLNQLKVARMSPESQKEAKAGLRRLLLETPGESGDA